MGAVDEYLNSVREQFGWHGVWLPGGDVDVGHFGSFSKKQLVVEGRLEVGFPLHVDQSPAPDFKAISDAGVQIMIKAAGTAPQEFLQVAEADAGVRVQFASSEAVAVAGVDCVTRRLTDQDELARRLISRAQADPGNWTGRWVVVEALLASRVCVLVSKGADAAFEMRVDAAVTDGLAAIAQIGGGAQVVRSNAVSVELTGGSGGVLVKVRRLHRNWLTGSWRLKATRRLSPEEAAEDELEDLRPLWADQDDQEPVS